MCDEFNDQYPVREIEWYMLPILWLGAFVFFGAALLVVGKDWVLRRVEQEITRMP